MAKVIDVSKDLNRHHTKRYKVRADLNRVNKIVVHTTDRNWTIEQLVEFDVKGKLTYENPLADVKLITDFNHIAEDGVPAITYHDVVMPDGNVYHTLPYREVSWHAGGYNSSSIAVALMYQCVDPNTNKDTYAPNDNMIKSLQCHCGDLCLDLKLSPMSVVGHRELQGTGWIPGSYGSKRLRKTCPGMKVDLDLLRKNIATYMQVQLNIKGLYTGAIDGLFLNQSRAALKRYARLNK